jgi:hypothetical protein
MATQKSARSLRIKSFRGSPSDLRIDFNAHRPLTLIYGENGSGKTTICDAFDFIANRKVGSLANRGLGQLHPFWPSAGKAGSEIVVELNLDGQTWTARAQAREVIVTPDDVPRPRVKLLRRSSLAEFVTSDPKDRYAALRPFIDLAHVEGAEQALRDQLRSANSRLEQAANQIQENRETLRRMMEQARGHSSEPLDWARKLAAPTEQGTATGIALRKSQQTIESALSAAESLDRADKAASESDSAATAAERALELAEQDAQTIDSSLVALLEAARVHLAQHPQGTLCPLCESADRVDGLADRVRDRIAAAGRLRDLIASARQHQTQRQTKIAMRLEALQHAQRAALAALEACRSAPPDWQAECAAAIQSLEAAARSQGDGFALDATALRQASDAAFGRVKAHEAAAAAFRQTKAVLAQHDENVTRQSSLSAVRPRLEQALKVCEKQRKAYLERTLDSIAGEVGRVYEIVHPGEGNSKVSFKLSATKRGSLDLGTEFQGTPDLPPQAYFSDSHLDSLGLCIFIALAALDRPGETIVVLDDILGSIDEPHVDRLISMIYEESQKFRQMVLTTHYRPWREKFRWGWLKHDQCEFVELGSWSQTSGIQQTGNGLTPLAELRGHLASKPPSLQAACAAAGVMLERACDFLVDRYELDVPRRRSGGLTLGDLLPRVAEKRLAAALRVEVLQTDGTYVDFPLGDRLIKLRDLMALRNVFGAHFNALAEQLPPQDAIAFATGVAEVMDALTCAEQGWPKSEKSGSYWATRGETRRLHPLKKPT